MLPDAENYGLKSPEQSTAAALNAAPGGVPPSRRRFLQSSIAAGMAAGILPALAGAREMARPAAAADAAEFELSEVTIADLQAGLASGKFTVRSITEKYLSRIEAIDRRGPAVNSVIEINHDALSI